MISPEAFHLGPLSIRWYGIMVACGFLAAYLLGIKRCKKYNLSSDAISDITFWAAVGGIAGARILYVIRYWNAEFASDPLSIIKIYQGGLVFLGGFAGAALAIFLLALKRRWPVSTIADFLAPMLPLGQAFGRIGCLLNGCCYGFKCESPISIQYEHVLFPAFPIQAASSIAALLACCLILWLEHKEKCRNYLFFIYLVLYCVGRFCLEFGRGDYPREQLLLGMTPAQITCLWLLPIICIGYAIFAFTRRTRNSRK